MEMRFASTSLGIKLPIPKSALSLGLTGGNGVTINFKQGFIQRVFAMSKPISIDGDGALGFTLLGTKWFKVKDPEKGVMIKDFDKKIADFAITSSLGFSKVDLSLKIYDENNQPWYTIEKVSIPNRGFSTTSFQLRAKLLLISTQGVHDEKDISTCIKSH